MIKHIIKNGIAGQICSKCDKWKPLAEYGPRKKGYAGLRARCRSCDRDYCTAYRETKHGREIIRKAMRKYDKSEKAAAKRTRYHKTEKWKIVNRRSVVTWCERNPIKKKAANAVHYAVGKGILAPFSEYACEDCNAQAELYHHESYKKEHWLDVTPLCRSCHLTRHR